MNAEHVRWMELTRVTQIALPHVKIAASWMQTLAPDVYPQGCHLLVATGCIPARAVLCRWPLHAPARVSACSCSRAEGLLDVTDWLATDSVHSEGHPPETPVQQRQEECLQCQSTAGKEAGLASAAVQTQQVSLMLAGLHRRVWAGRPVAEKSLGIAEQPIGLQQTLKPLELMSP